MKIGILGPGSLALVIGAFMIRKNFDVTFIDSPRGNNKDILNSKGVTITGTFDLKVPAKAILPQEITEPFDYIFALTKIPNLRESLEGIMGTGIGENTTVITCQNGVPEDIALEAVPKKQILPCSVAWGATRLEPGVSQVTTAPEKMNMVVGEFNGEFTQRVSEVASIMEPIGRISISDNIMGVKWTKLVMNTIFMGPCCLMGCTIGDVLFDDEYVKVAPAIAYEGVQVMNSKNIKGESLQGFKPELARLNFTTTDERSDLIESVYRNIWAKLKAIRPSMLQDLEQGRKTEIDFINGKIHSEGQALGIATPANTFFTEKIKLIEAGELKPGPENREMLLDFIRNTLTRSLED
jgi:2-dehydropantoate 2-reductase